MSQERLEVIRTEKNYFIKRYNEETNLEQKDFLYMMVLLTEAAERVALDELQNQSSAPTANEEKPC